MDTCRNEKKEFCKWCDTDPFRSYSADNLYQSRGRYEFCDFIRITYAKSMYLLLSM